MEEDGGAGEARAWGLRVVSTGAVEVVQWVIGGGKLTS